MSEQITIPQSGPQRMALMASTVAFTICFAVWTIFAIIGVQIKQDMGLTDTEFSLLIGTPILTGSIIRLVLGIWADQYGGRPIFMAVMLSSAFFTWCLVYADTYAMLLLTALGVGISGGSFVVGIAYLSKWYGKDHQGTALGVYGMGNIGAAVTKFIAPFVMVAYGWHMVAQVWAVSLVIMALLFWVLTRDEPQISAQKANKAAPKSMRESLLPLKKMQVWRFSVYYFFVFGGFVALALWLPRYYVGVYHMDIKEAGMLAAAFSVSGSLFRAIGGYLSDKIGARAVMYVTFIVCTICCFLLSYPATDYTIHGIKGDITFSFGWGFAPFTVIVFVLGLFMSFGKAAIYKHIPVYYPNDVGSVAGIVGLIGGLGGFFLPLAFGLMNDYLNVWTGCFMLMFLLVAIALIWMHVAIRMQESREFPALSHPRFFPEMDGMVMNFVTGKQQTVEDWQPESAAFWEKDGARIANRNLWISVPSLLLAFATWFIWSAVAVNLNNVGFNFSQEQLFTLAAMPGITGAILRLFYSFLVPILGGRNWTVISTLTLLIPAFLIGDAVQHPLPTDPDHPSYAYMLVLAALCGFGGGNFSSSMANISYFFPKRKQGMALGVNAGLGNLGVSVMQFLAPIVTSMAVFGALGGDPQTWVDAKDPLITKSIWLQNAAYVWIVPILVCSIAAMLGMNNLTTSKASLASQLVIFRRKHMYLTCWLYIMSFGSFIGFSAAFPLLIKSQFPEVNPLTYAFLGPLVGALIRPVGGWVSDKLNSGAKVTLYDLYLMIASSLAVLWFIHPDHKDFTGFLISFLVLFVSTGIANGSVFRMIGVIFPPAEKAPVLGFTGAVAAFGAFFIPKSFGFSIAQSGSIAPAFYCFIAYYVTCIAVTWWWYSRRRAEMPC